MAAAALVADPGGHNGGGESGWPHPTGPISGTAASTVAVSSDSGSLPRRVPDSTSRPLSTGPTIEGRLAGAKQLNESSEDWGVGMPGLKDGEGGRSVVK